ncbi:MAG: DEAD/DEAH box helicase family protein [Candidatus Peregrinibacteria bacterium]|nr:DEAD/DEAH box helicase family protein [Candidatus Peregrinibacteria bacterium]
MAEALTFDDTLLHVTEAGDDKERSRDNIVQVALFQRLLWNMTVNAAQAEERMAVPLRVNQMKAIRALAEFLRKNGNGSRSGTFILPTGAGKTILYAVISKLLDVRTLVLEPRTNLVAQTHKTFIEQAGIQPEKIGLLTQDQEQLTRPITITNYHAHRARLQRDPVYRNHIQQCELIICNEAHRALGPATQASIDAIEQGLDPELTEEEEEVENEVCGNLDKHTNRHALKLAFTATSQLMRKDVHTFFGPIISRESHGDLVKDGILAKYKIVQVPGHIHPGEIGSTISEKQEVQLLKREKVYEKAIERFLRLQEEVRERLLPIAFCSSIRECDSFRKLFHEKASSQGLKCEVVTNREVRKRRTIDIIQEAQDKLLNGDLGMLASVDKLQLGWDFPPLNTVLQLRATTSPAVLIQQAGRASRRTSNKEFAYIIEPRWRRDIHEVGGGSGGGSGGGDNAQTRDSMSASPQKFYATPLTLAEALNILDGGDVDAACERIDGKKLSYDIVKSLREDGTVELGEETCIYLDFFAQFHDYPQDLLLREVQRAGLQAVGVAVFQKQYVPVYRQRDILALPGLQEYRTKQKLHSAYGVLIDESIYITMERFAMYHGVPLPSLEHAVQELHMQPLSRVFADESFTLYRRTELESLVYIQQNSTLREVAPGASEVEIKGINGIIPKYFALLNRLDPRHLESICREQLLTIGYALSIGNPEPIFAKAEVLSIPIVREWLRLSALPEINQDTALAGLAGGGVGLSLSQFSLLHPSIEYQQLLREVHAMNLQPIGVARYNFSRVLIMSQTSGGTNYGQQHEVQPTSEKVYSREQIVNLPYVEQCLKREKELQSPQPTL